MKKKDILTALLLLGSTVQAQNWPEIKPEARPGSRWWWMGSAVDQKGLAYNLHKYGTAGIGSLEITPIYGVKGNEQRDIPFLSSRWMEMYQYTQDEAQKNGIDIDMNTGTGWPFGGPEITLEHAATRAIFEQYTVTGGKKIEQQIEITSPKEQKQREFFSAASHELKTPLTILKGHLTGMLNKVKGYENREVYMERSLAVVEKMETLVKELLYLSKTDESQKSEYKMIDLAELLRVQIADVTELLSEKELSLTVDIPDKLLCEVDSAQMERALQNILINAIRYSPNGEEINISLSNEKNTNIVFCKIENTGVTIPEEEISHLFEAFYRVDASRNRNTGGTGLGLYIVRKIMDLHHAKYGIKNSDRGVLFWFKMPQRRSDSDSI